MHKGAPLSSPSRFPTLNKALRAGSNADAPNKRFETGRSARVLTKAAVASSQSPRKWFVLRGQRSIDVAADASLSSRCWRCPQSVPRVASSRFETPHRSTTPRTSDCGGRGRTAPWAGPPPPKTDTGHGTPLKRLGMSLEVTSNFRKRDKGTFGISATWGCRQVIIWHSIRKKL